jgi:cellulose synthase/poly-beta-1,6-N-acetylglucosamine synthase-like glycosyltransferase
MSLSVVIRSKDEADRLRLTLTSLIRQSASAEVVVVNDGSSDHTRAVLDEVAGSLPLTVVHHVTPRGRSGAANAGARAASGQVLLFLDGDTLAHPDLVRHHATAHAERPGIVGRGERLHLRCTSFFQDPETGTPRPSEIGRLERRTLDERQRLRVTRSQILDDFQAVARRAETGTYPGAGPRRLEELEMDALRRNPDCSVLWAAACGSNLSIPRDAFLDIGGFNEAIDISEQRELALRLCQAGLDMVPVDGAQVYHMTHRRGWRDPLVDTGWEAAFYAAHPIPAVKLLAVFWASLSPQSQLPAEARILSLPALDAAARGATAVNYDEARRWLGLPALEQSTPATSGGGGGR